MLTVMTVLVKHSPNFRDHIQRNFQRLNPLQLTSLFLLTKRKAQRFCIYLSYSKLGEGRKGMEDGVGEAVIKNEKMSERKKN